MFLSSRSYPASRALVAVFVLASKTTDAFQMAKWSSRNVIPAKIALGVMFAILGVLVLPGLGAWLAELVGRAV